MEEHTPDRGPRLPPRHRSETRGRIRVADVLELMLDALGDAKLLVVPLAYVGLVALYMAAPVLAVVVIAVATGVLAWGVASLSARRDATVRGAELGARAFALGMLALIFGFFVLWATVVGVDLVLNKLL